MSKQSVFTYLIIMLSLIFTLSAHADDFWDEDDDFFREIEQEYLESPFIGINDPLESLNRKIFVFNDKMLLWVLKPVSTGWKKITPSPVRIGIRNFFDNISSPVRIVNQLLQGKGKAASAETGKFLVNSIWGVFGFIDASKKLPSLQVPKEDLGQTLAKWGVGNGCYLVLPFIGPSSLRDGVGEIGDFFLQPMTYVDWYDMYDYLGVQSVKVVNTSSFHIGDYEALKDLALDPYTALRDAYIQKRNKDIAE